MTENEAYQALLDAVQNQAVKVRPGEMLVLRSLRPTGVQGHKALCDEMDAVGRQVGVRFIVLPYGVEVARAGDAA